MAMVIKASKAAELETDRQRLNMNADKARTAKWFWKMSYCKKHGLAPAQNEVWDYVETKWQEAQPLTKEND